jgi:SAM-dependent methyltransferase
MTNNRLPITDKVWQGDDLTNRYLNGVRGAIPFAQAQMDTMLWLIRGSQTAVTSVLDLGCGDGILGQAVLDAYPAAQGLFADFSAPMLAAAEKRLAGYNGRITLREVDYGQPTWCENLTGFFDVIVSGYSIHHQPDGRKREIYTELYHLLQPGGIFINVEHVASRSSWGEKLFEEAFVDSMVAYHAQISSDKSREQISTELYNRPDKAANILAPVETQCDWLRDIGFIHVDCYLKYFELAVFAGVKPKNM